MCKLMSKSPYTTYTTSEIKDKEAEYENMDTVYTIFSKTIDSEDKPQFTLLKKEFFA